MTRGARRLIWIAASFLLFSITTRVGLAIFSDENYVLFEWARFMGAGILFGLTVLSCVLLPWAVYDAVMPEFVYHHFLYKWEQRWAAVWGTLFLSFFAVIAVAEFAFWAEFAIRFDFIAVDYLVYTHEVIGNIRESYPVYLWMTAILGICSAIAWFSWPRGGNDPRSTWIVRLRRTAVVGLS